LTYSLDCDSEYEPEKNVVFLTISVPELDPTFKLDISASRITFVGHASPPAGTNTASKVEPKTCSSYTLPFFMLDLVRLTDQFPSTTFFFLDEFDLELFSEVEEVKRVLTGKSLSLVLKKVEAKEDYWPRLTKEKVKLNFVKVRIASSFGRNDWLTISVTID
jgi:hypothetical protein